MTKEMDKNNKSISTPSLAKSEIPTTVAKEIDAKVEPESSPNKNKSKQIVTQKTAVSGSTSKIDSEANEKDESGLDEDSKVDTPLRTWLDFKKLNTHMTEALPELEKYLNECDFNGKGSHDSFQLNEQIDMLLKELSRQDVHPDKPGFDEEVSNMKLILCHIKESIEKAKADSIHQSPSQELLPLRYSAHFGKIHHLFRNRPKKHSNSLPMKSHSETNTQKAKSILQGSKSASNLHRAVHSNRSGAVNVSFQEQKKHPLVFPKSYRPYVNRRKHVDINAESDENYIANINRLTIGTVRTRRLPTKDHFQNTLFETVHRAKITEPDRLSMVSNFPRHASHSGKYLGDPIEAYIPDSARRHRWTSKSFSSKSSLMDGRGDMGRKTLSDASLKKLSGHGLTEKGKVNDSSSKKLSFLSKGGKDGGDGCPSEGSCNLKGSAASLPRIDSKYGPLKGKGSSALALEPALVHHHQVRCSACGRKARCLACEQDARAGKKTISCHQRLHKSKMALDDKKNELFRPKLRGDTIEQPAILDGLDLTNPLVLYNLKGCSQAEECYWELVCDTIKRCKGTSYIHFLSDHKRHCCDACNSDVDRRMKKALNLRSFIKPPNSEMYCENAKTQSLGYGRVV